MDSRVTQDGTAPARLLFLDDDALARKSWVRLGREHGVLVVAVATPDEVRAALRPGGVSFQAVLCDFHLKWIHARLTSEALVRELLAKGVSVAVLSADVEAVEDIFGTEAPIFCKSEWERVFRSFDAERGWVSY